MASLREQCERAQKRYDEHVNDIVRKTKLSSREAEQIDTERKKVNAGIALQADSAFNDSAMMSDLRDAYEMAEHFSLSQDKNGEYKIKEGWDLFDIIHSLVTLWRRNKILEQEVKRGKNHERA